MWGFIINILIQIAVGLLLASLAPDPDIQDPPAAKLEDFNFPTADNSRPIPVVFGTSIVQGPNVVWYGDFSVVKKKRKEKVEYLGITVKTYEVIEAYNYHIGLQMAIGNGPLNIRKIILGDDNIVYTSSGSGQVDGSIDEPRIFNSDSEQVSNGIGGDFTFYSGNTSQTADSYLTTHLTEVPGYRGLSYIVFKDFYIGNTPSTQPFKFEVERFYKPSFATGSANIGDDNNPAWIVYDILTNKSYGAGIDPSDIDEVSFQDAADALDGEGLGLSLTFDSSISVDQFMKEVSKYIDGDIIYNKTVNKFQIQLSRSDYDINLLPLFDKTNTKDIKFNRPSIYESVSEVKIQFTDRSKLYQTNIAQFQDLGLRYNKNSQDSTIRNYPWVTNKTLANKIAARDIRPVATSLAQVEFTTNTDAFDLSVGDVIKLTWEPYNIENMVLRITSINYGLFNRNSIKISAIQDKFGVTDTSYVPPADTGWNPIDTSVGATTFNVIEAPYYFNNSSAFNTLLMWAKDPADGAISFEMWSEDPTNTFVKNNVGSNGFAPEGTLTGAEDANSVSFDITNSSNMNELQNRPESDVALGLNLAWVDDGGIGEFIGFTTVVDNGGGSFTISGIKRGLLDTSPKKFSGGEAIYFFTEGFVAGDMRHSDAEVVGNKCLPASAKEVLDLGSSSTINVTIDERAAKPLRPVNVQGYDVTFPSNSDAPTPIAFDPLDLNWEHRKQISEVTVRFYDDGDATIDDDTEYLVEYFNDGNGTAFYSTVTTGLTDKQNISYNPTIAFGDGIYITNESFVNLQADDFGVDIDLSFLGVYGFAPSSPGLSGFTVLHPTLGLLTEGIDYTLVKNLTHGYVEKIQFLLSGGVSIGDTVDVFYVVFNCGLSSLRYKITPRRISDNSITGDPTDHTIQ